MSQLVTIFGGSGFLGRYIARRMAKNGWRVRVAVRRPNEAMHVKPYGSVGQVEPVLCNIRDDDSVGRALEGADAVVNCVGTFDRTGRNNFDAIQHLGVERIGRLSAAMGIENFVHISAIGANADSECDYFKTKGLGEEALKDAQPSAVILRPSVMFGAEDGFFNRFAGLSRFGPAMALVGGDSKFQPVFVDDVAAAAERAILGNVSSGTYELGGPQVATLRAWIEQMLVVIERRKLIVNLPFPVGRIIAGLLDFGQTITGGLFRNSILTRDQVTSLESDNIVGEQARGFDDLGLTPRPVDQELEGYLWPYRPSGQFAAIKASADNLKA